MASSAALSARRAEATVASAMTIYDFLSLGMVTVQVPKILGLKCGDGVGGRWVDKRVDRSRRGLLGCFWWGGAGWIGNETTLRQMYL